MLDRTKTGELVIIPSDRFQIIVIPFSSVRSSFRGMHSDHATHWPSVAIKCKATDGNNYTFHVHFMTAALIGHSSHSRIIPCGLSADQIPMTILGPEAIHRNREFFIHSPSAHPSIDRTNVQRRE